MSSLERTTGRSRPKGAPRPEAPVPGTCTQGESYRAAERRARDLFFSCGIADAAADAWYLMEYVTKMDRTAYLLRRDERMPKASCAEYWELVLRRAEHVPLQYLTGVQEFMGFPFRVNGHVLIPRQDTEILAERALQEAPEGGKVLDLCTGSGCIAISLKKLRPDLAVAASDLSEEALGVARENGRALGAEVAWIRSDLFEKIGDRYDLVVSNPPYICTEVIGQLSPEVRLHEPLLALDGHADGLYFYRRILSEIPGHLAPGGKLLFEIGWDQGEAVRELMDRAGFCKIQIGKDLAGLDRVAAGRMPG